MLFRKISIFIRSSKKPRHKMFHVILIVGISAATVYALECGIITGDRNKDINKVIASCSLLAVPVPAEKTTNITRIPDGSDEDGMEQIPAYGPRRGIIRRNRRSDETFPHFVNVDSTMPNTNETDIKDPKKCVPHCILQKLKLLDAKEYPEHETISHFLTKNLENREMRDFVQDSVDECFQVMLDYLVEQRDTCACAAKLVICLAEKGKYNCADWPVGELPFPHNI